MTADRSTTHDNRLCLLYPGGSFLLKRLPLRAGVRRSFRVNQCKSARANCLSAIFPLGTPRAFSNGRKGLPKIHELTDKIEKYLKTIFLIHIRRTPAPRLLYPSASE